MTQPTKGTSKLADSTHKPQIGERGAAVTAAIAPAAFSAPATGSAITVTTNDAADLTTVADALEALRDEVALNVTAINAVISAMEAHGLIADN